MCLLFFPLILSSCGVEEEEKVEVNENVIPGLMPVDVYLSLENEGFETEESTNELGYLWINTKIVENYSYRVETFTTESKSVESIRATAVVGNGDEITGSLSFFRMISSVPYENADPQKVATWLFENFDTDGSTLVVSGVLFELKAPSDNVRFLNITKSKE